MKKILILALSLFSIKSYSQCTTECTGTIVTSTTPIYNQSYNGNVCFIGNFDINNSNNWNGWNILTFDGKQGVTQTVNFQNGAKKMYTGTNSLVNFSNISFDGSDSLFVGAGAFTRIFSLTTNNSGNNAIVLFPGASVEVHGVLYTTPAYMQTVSTNPTNSITLYACGTVLSISLKYFKQEDDVLKWEFASAPNYATLQHKEYGNWKNVESYYPVNGVVYSANSYEGLFRLKMEELTGEITYSNTINIHKPSPFSTPLIRYYNMVGQELAEKPIQSPYIIRSNTPSKILFKTQ